jgi:uncharacterized protein (TIGR03067 family)
MRNILFILLLVPGLGFIVANNDLNGKWVTIKLIMDGNELPEETFKNQQLILTDTSYTFIAESVDKGVVKYTGNKIDIYGKDGVNAGNHFTALYKLENGILTICYNMAGDKYPEDFETKGKPMYFVAVFKKEEAKQ